jgi:hypothetical protein
MTTNNIINSTADDNQLVNAFCSSVVQNQFFFQIDKINAVVVKSNKKKIFAYLDRLKIIDCCLQCLCRAAYELLENT